jgi:hypothetical protein
MYDITTALVKLRTDTGYDCDWAKAKEPSLLNDIDPPRVFIGYHSITALGHLGQGEAPDPYMYFAEDLSQMFTTQITCAISLLPTAWHKVHNSLSGWIALPAEKEFTGIYHSDGGVMGLDNGRIWWLDNWRLDFPRASRLV